MRSIGNIRFQRDAELHGWSPSVETRLNQSCHSEHAQSAGEEPAVPPAAAAKQVPRAKPRRFGMTRPNGARRGAHSIAQHSDRAELKCGSVAYNSLLIPQHGGPDGLRHDHQERHRGHGHRHLHRRRRHRERQDLRHRSEPSRGQCEQDHRRLPTNSSSPAASTCIRISTCPSAAPPAPTISKPARAPPPSAERPR